ncbi:nuclear transport factor 2 family protein [Williamsia sp.]|uniref:nuclear transport factor 2 family protein n=1 Tax=Williamsia sp. TaxID=1872085 RepID=UPI001A2CFF58|nr:nuclear transport factor 2 family protein [Williamsia sp.]MBJ7291081.1 nuclear transport factor 2 family protein [Williamsia sp.]
MTTTVSSDIIRRYFELAPAADTDAYFAQFATDAVVVDEGKTRRGIDEIRAWRTEVPPVRYGVRSIAAVGSGHDAVAEISGDFPGSPVDLRFRFEIDDEGLIRGLVIGNP